MPIVGILKEDWPSYSRTALSDNDTSCANIGSIFGMAVSKLDQPTLLPGLLTLFVAIF